MRAAAYVRVSTDEQAESGLGLEAQRAVLRADAERRGWEVTIFEDAGYTGRDTRRPALTTALERLDRGEHCALLSARLDRLSRSLVDFAHLMERSKRRGWSLICLDLGVDTSTPQGKMVANIFATFAEFESDLIGQRTAAALAEKRKQGVKLGRPRTISGQALDAIARLRARGLSYRAAAAELNDAGIPTAHGGKWWPETVRLIDQRGARCLPPSPSGPSPRATRTKPARRRSS